MIARTQPVGVKLDAEPTPLPRRTACSCSECQAVREEIAQVREEVRSVMMEFRRGLQIMTAAVDAQYGESRRSRERREKQERNAA